MTASVTCERDMRTTHSSLVLRTFAFFPSDFRAKESLLNTSFTVLLRVNKSQKVQLINARGIVQTSLLSVNRSFANDVIAAMLDDH